MKKIALLLTLIILTGCASSDARYQHSEQAVQAILNEKIKYYNEQKDGVLYGIDLKENGPQGLIFDRIDPETGANTYSKLEYTTDGKIRTNIQLDEGGRIIKLDRYWFAFPRADMDAILAAQNQLFESNYAIKLKGMTESGEHRFLTKDELFRDIQSRSLECNNRCMRLTSNDKGVSKIISSVGYNYFWLNGDSNRFVQVAVETRYMKEYKSSRINKYK